jgi:cytochrome b6-f complex iron-sulfur subunit
MHRLDGWIFHLRSARTRRRDAAQTGTSRREFLIFGWGVVLAGLTVAAASASLRFLRPQTRSGEVGGVFDVGSLEQMPAVGDPPLASPRGRFWLVNTDAGLLAISSTCTHLSCLVEWDALGGQYVCPCHGSRFAGNGRYLEGPASRSLDRYVIRLVKDGQPLVETDLSGVPLLPPKEATGDVRVSVDSGRKIAGPAAR